MPTYDEILCGNGVVEMFLSFTSQKKSPIGIPVTLKHLKENSADPEVQSAKPIIITENALSNKPNRAASLLSACSCNSWASSDRRPPV